jgi:FkbM family methyltransferase
LQRSFLGIYAGAKAAGVMESGLAKRVFLSTYFLYKRYFEDPFAGLVKRYPSLFQGGHILDVGANVGYTAGVFAGVLTQGFQVYAFEPDPATFATLESVLSSKKLATKVVPVWAAVGASDGWIDMWHNEQHGADHRIFTEAFSRIHTEKTQVARVPLRTVDSFVAEQVSGPVQFIKIDAQGYEPAVCAGMERTLACNPRAVVAVEYAPQGISELGLDPGEIPAFFEKHGFRIAMVDHCGRIVPAGRERIAVVLEKREYLDLICSRQPFEST